MSHTCPDAPLHTTPSAEHIMAMFARVERRWTAAAVRELMEQQPGSWPRYELIDGQLLVSPSPRLRHYRALMWLFDALTPFVNREKLGRVAMSPADISLEPESIVQPDLFLVLPAEEAAAREWSDFTRLPLVVEVLSPSTAQQDRGRKRVYYQRNGVGEYWVVDLELRLIERWRPNEQQPEVVRDRLVWQPGDIAAPLTLELAELWRAARLD